MTGIEKIVHEGLVLGIVVRQEATVDQSTFFTEDHDFFQAGLLRYHEHEVEPHVHRETPRGITGTSEFLLIRKGKARVDFYTKTRSYVQSIELGVGDAVILTPLGGHGVHCQGDCSILEIKQGPYLGDRDKTRFQRPACVDSPLKCEGTR